MRRILVVLPMAWALYALALSALADERPGSRAPRVGAGTIELECLVEPRKSVLLSAPIEGVVDSILVERGEQVKKGQVVATLESSVQRATVELARSQASADAELKSRKAELDLENARLGRARKLFQEALISDLEIEEFVASQLVAEAAIDQARENRKIARLELRRAEASLELRSIRSPVDGVVVEHIVSPGEFADPPQVLEIAQTDPLNVEVFAPISLYGRFEVGATARVELEEPLGGEYEARVVVVDGVANAASGTFGVRLELPNPDGEILAGVKCKVSF